MKLNDDQGLVRWLTACRFDIAHHHGWSTADIETWVKTNFAEGLARFNAAMQESTQAADEPDENGRTALEHAMAVTKTWAQASL